MSDIDIVGGRSFKSESVAASHNQNDIRTAYMEYLQNASKSDVSRIDALQRLAQLEFELIDKLAESKGEYTALTLSIEDQIQTATLDRSIQFLELSLHDYPDAESNDQILYQLARAHDQKGEYLKSLSALQGIIQQYPNSSYYAESQFRLAEAAFSGQEYMKAEDLYTEVLVSRDNEFFRRNARYKRGWARFKQEFYHEAIDDFSRVIEESNFSGFETLKDAERAQFNEYFRAFGLSFIYLGGATALNEYFEKHNNLNFAYETYANVSDIYRDQQRYSDAAGLYEHFLRNHAGSRHAPYSALRIVDTWKDSGFTNMVISSLENLYLHYNPDSKYWQYGAAEKNAHIQISAALKDYIVLAASHYHKEFTTNGKKASFENSATWYERYLKHYEGQSQKDNIHFLYADLLYRNMLHPKALHHYEIAAFDSGIILNRDAAYLAIQLATHLHRDTQANTDKNYYLMKLVDYSLLYSQLYPNDENTMRIILHAAQESYHAGLYDEAITLTELFGAETYTRQTYDIHVIKAHAYFKKEQFRDAEQAYLAVITNHTIDSNSRQQIQDNLAISIYTQASVALEKQEKQQALIHYARIVEVAPDSDIAATGMYDALNLAMQDEKWHDAIQFGSTFQNHYPSHKFTTDVSRHLSVAYLNSNQDIKAASELMKISRSEQDPEFSIAALWKAAELFESKRDYASAIKSYEEYANNHQRQYPQYLESMNKLIELNGIINNEAQIDKWRNAILDADRRTPADQKSDRTRFIASQSALALARRKHEHFSKVRLTIPLKQSLERKKRLMQEAVNLYGRASSYGIADTATEAVHAIGDIYQSFSTALLESDRPRNLNTVELEQYNILLEDQAFPFEERAIEFYETNLGHVKDGVFDNWVEKSHERLTDLFPARYARELIMEPYINVLH